MMYQPALLALILCLLTSGCSKNPFADPVSQLKDHLSNVSNGRTANYDNEWQNIKYDVEKTNSLVSPYAATISAEVCDFYSKTDTKPYARDNYEMVLAYQDGDWVLRDVKHQTYFLHGDTWDPYRSKEDLRAGDTDWDMVRMQLKLRR